MIYHHKKNGLETNVSNTRHFQINASAHAFKVLSESLYSDKISAIIRELSSNAYDSHAMIGKKDIPFDVFLPTRFNSNFIIRDYGVGLTEDEIYSLFTTFFSSNKQDTNDALGFFGIGSKTPYAYTDSFTVISYTDNKELIYGCYLDQSGIPTVSKISEYYTDEENGLKISIPIHQKDFNEFHKKAANIYQWFDVKPNSSPEIYYSSLPEIFIKGDWGQFYNIHDNTIIIKYGQIAYPITYYSLCNNVFPNSDIDNIIESISINRFLIILNFNIGELEVTPSRESLSYTELTRKNIRNKLIEACTDISKQIENKVKESKTFYEACVNFQKYRHLFSRYGNLSFEWNGKPVISNFNLSQDFSYRGVYLFASRSFHMSPNNFPIESLFKTTFVIKDEKRKITYKDISKQIGNDIVFVNNEENIIDWNKEKANFLSAIPGFPEDKIVLQSSLKKSPTITNKNKKQNIHLEKLTVSGYVKIEEINEKIEELSGIFIPTYSNKLLLNYKREQNEEPKISIDRDMIFEILKVMKKMGLLDDKNIFIVKSKYCKKASNNPKLESFIDFYSDILSEYSDHDVFNSMDHIDYSSDLYKIFNNIVGNEFYKNTKLYKEFNKIIGRKNTDLNNLIKNYRNIYPEINLTIKNILSDFQYNLNRSQIQNKIQKLIDKYPFIVTPVHFGLYGKYKLPDQELIKLKLIKEVESC